MSEFEKIRANTIVSDSGFSVEVLGRTGIEYWERERSLRIDSEVLSTPTGIALYRNSIRAWRSPHENEELDDANRQRIINNVVRAFASQGQRVQVIG
jgi:hypothetical protein